MRIMPSGNGSRDWLPKLQIKTASTNGEEAQEEVVEADSLLEAAQKVVANMAGSGCYGGDDFEGAKAPEFETNDNEFASDEDAVEFEGEPSDVAEETPATGEEAAVEALGDAVEALGDAVEALGGDVGESDNEVEMEIEVDVDDDEFDSSTEPVAEDDLVAEGNTEKCCPKCNKPGPCKCDTEDCCTSNEEEMAVSASSDDWVRTSAISPKNRKQVYDYWSKQLGYPKDFVKLMVKDYE